MDITRNWRLKSSRSQLLASRCPVTGQVVLPQQTASTVNEDGSRLFEEATTARRSVEAVEYAQAAR